MSRQYETEIEIHAPIEAVWKALADADELAQWFVEKARIEPREGGVYWRSWGDNMTSEVRIDAWEPGRRLRLRNVPERQEGVQQVWQLDPQQQPMIEEYIFEARGDITVLRVIQSGIPDSADWDGFYEGTKHGWETAFAVLRFYLEHHRGQLRHPCDVRLWTTLPQDKAFTAAARAFNLPTVAGERFQHGEDLEGAVLQVVANHSILACVENLNEALLALRTQATGDKTMVWLSLSTFGDQPAIDDQHTRRWTRALEAALS